MIDLCVKFKKLFSNGIDILSNTKLAYAWTTLSITPDPIQRFQRIPRYQLMIFFIALLGIRKDCIRRCDISCWPFYAFYSLINIQCPTTTITTLLSNSDKPPGGRWYCRLQVVGLEYGLRMSRSSTWNLCRPILIGLTKALREQSEYTSRCPRQFLQGPLSSVVAITIKCASTPSYKTSWGPASSPISWRQLKQSSKMKEWKFSSHQWQWLLISLQRRRRERQRAKKQRPRNDAYVDQLPVKLIYVGSKPSELPNSNRYTPTREESSVSSIDDL